MKTLLTFLLLAGALVAQRPAVYSPVSSLAPGAVVPVAQGGTGAVTFTDNGILYGNGTSPIQGSAALTLGRVPYATTDGVLIDDADLTFNGTSLLFGATTPGGITGSAGSLTFTAAGTNQNITLTPSGTGMFVQQNATVKFVVNEFASDGFIRFHALATATTPTTSTSFLAFGGGTTVFLNSPNGSGTFEFQRNGTAMLNLTGGAAASLTGGAGNMTITSGVGNSRTMTLRTTTSGGTATNAMVFGATQTVTSYANVATAGHGLVAIRAAGRVTAQSAANASISTFTVGAADGSFEVSANMNVTASTVLTTTLTCTYTDESNTARSMILPVTALAGTFVTAGAITGAGASVWSTPAMHIRCKAATVITILTSAGTFTGVTYTAGGVIQQLD